MTVHDRTEEPTSDVVATSASIRAEEVRMVPERRYEMLRRALKDAERA